MDVNQAITGSTLFGGIEDDVKTIGIIKITAIHSISPNISPKDLAEPYER
jgi:hypothetical protein